MYPISEDYQYKDSYFIVGNLWLSIIVLSFIIITGVIIYKILRNKRGTEMKFDFDEMMFDSIKRDKINLNNNGFFMVTNGRAGIIYFVENQLVIPMGIEMPAVDYLDVLVYGELDHIEKRYNTTKHTVEILLNQERRRIQKLLFEWLNEKGLRHDLKIQDY